MNEMVHRLFSNKYIERPICINFYRKTIKYKSVMLDINGYSKLAEAKTMLSRKMGVSLSFNDLVLELVSRRFEFLNVDASLKNYITKFADRIKCLDYVFGAILFGSVARETFTENSDIDILILTERDMNNKFSRLMDITRSLKEDERALMEKGLPSLITPIFLNIEDTKIFRPIYFDIVDYGIILFEKGNFLSDFMSTIRKVKHKRELINNVEVLTWR